MKANTPKRKPAYSLLDNKLPIISSLEFALGERRIRASSD